MATPKFIIPVPVEVTVGFLVAVGTMITPTTWYVRAFGLLVEFLLIVDVFRRPAWPLWLRAICGIIPAILIAAATVPQIASDYVGPASPSPPLRTPQTLSFRQAFSLTDRVNTLPSQLGGKPTINVDNILTLRKGPEYSLNRVSIILDPVTIRLPDVTDRRFVMSDITIMSGYKQQLIFDTTTNKRHLVEVEGRTFVITLVEINPLSAPQVAVPLEFVFTISEK